MQPHLKIGLKDMRAEGKFTDSINNISESTYLEESENKLGYGIALPLLFNLGKNRNIGFELAYDKDEITVNPTDNQEVKITVENFITGVFQLQF